MKRKIPNSTRADRIRNKGIRGTAVNVNKTVCAEVPFKHLSVKKIHSVWILHWTIRWIKLSENGRLIDINRTVCAHLTIWTIESEDNPVCVHLAQNYTLNQTVRQWPTYWHKQNSLCTLNHLNNWEWRQSTLCESCTELYAEYSFQTMADLLI